MKEGFFDITGNPLVDALAQLPFRVGDDVFSFGVTQGRDSYALKKQWKVTHL